VVSDYDGVFDAARDDATFASGRSEHGGTGLNNVIPKAPVRLHIPSSSTCPSTAATARSSTRSPRPAAVSGCSR
jgi:hypothetical protein